MNVTLLATILAISFFSIGVYAYRRKEVMWFWSSPTYQQLSFHDPVTFNHKTGIMWMLFGIAFFLPVPFRYFHFFKENIFIMLLSCILTIGLFVMMIYWHHLYQIHRK